MKHLFAVLCAISICPIFAQDLSDAILFSEDNNIGTARYNAMGGAFNSLGGDVSAISLNPASSAVFERSESSITLKYNKINNDTRYYGNTISTDEDDFDINQVGGAFVFNNTGSNWQKFSIGFNYDLVDVYDNQWIANGTSTNSIDSYFLNFAQGKRLEDIKRLSGETYSQAYAEIGNVFGYGHQQAFLGYEGFVIEPSNNTNENTNYFSLLGTGHFNQDYIYTTSGYNSKIAFNFATQYKDKLYLGLNLNSHYLNYNRKVNIYEANNNADAEITDVEFQTDLSSIGYGFSFQLGAIYKITEQWRAGLTYSSPTWFKIEDETTQFIETFNVNDPNAGQSIFPDIINVFPRYKLQTPGKITAGLSHIFGPNGLISLDYSIRDYSNVEFKDDGDPNFKFQNQLANTTLKVASTIKIGGEYRIQQWRFRGGYGFHESPYKKSDIGTGDMHSYSAGLGFKFLNNFTVDFSYNFIDQTNRNQLFNTGLTDVASVKQNNNRFLLSLNYNL